MSSRPTRTTYNGERQVKHGDGCGESIRLVEVFDFYAQGLIHPTITTRELGDIDAIFDEMEHAQIDGQVVIEY